MYNENELFTLLKPLVTEKLIYVHIKNIYLHNSSDLVEVSFPWLHSSTSIKNFTNERLKQNIYLEYCNTRSFIEIRPKNYQFGYRNAVTKLPIRLAIKYLKITDDNLKDTILEFIDTL